MPDQLTESMATMTDCKSLFIFPLFCFCCSFLFPCILLVFCNTCAGNCSIGASSEGGSRQGDMCVFLPGEIQGEVLWS